MNNYKLIKEFNDEVLCESTIEESTGIKKWTISGITLQSDIRNRNKRLYPKSVLSEAVSRHVGDHLKSGRALGELNHPDQGMSSINLDRVSHKFVSVVEEGNNYITKAEVLDTPCGKIVQNLLEGNVQLGISSRGLGNVKNDNDGVLVESLYLVSLGDIVSDPSCRDAYVNGILESVEYTMIKEGGDVKFVLSQMDKYSKALKEASKEDVAKAVGGIFDDMLAKVFRKH